MANHTVQRTEARDARPRPLTVGDMRQVGLRELKNHLSRYVRQVRAGYDIQITDRGEVVAELLPPRCSTGAKAQRGLADLARRGLVSLVRPHPDPKARDGGPLRGRRTRVQRELVGRGRG